MKITKLEIKDFHQFKNFELDLTYPEGHAKAGEPLDKICIIGQSGTGKTKLLELLSGLTHNIRLVKRKYNLEKKQARISISDNELNYKKGISDKDLDYGVSNYLKNNQEISFEDFVKIHDDYVDRIKPNLIYFPAETNLEIVSNNEIITNNINDDAQYDYNNQNGYEEDVTFIKKSVYDFSIENPSEIWNIILDDIEKYQLEELTIRQEISRVAEDTDIDVEAIQISVKKLENWRSKSFNPIQDIADNCLNPILKRLNLQVKTDLDIKKKDDIGFIKVEDKNKNEIPYGLLSTGTKQILLSALPLYLLKPNQTLIFFDEPERSLYPDLQRDIVSYYQGLTTDSQLFFATHSPIIASSFEPWEIVELKFNREEGYVYQEKYYDEEKGRHVDNYFIDPNFLTIDLILTKVFDLTETHSPVRNEQIGEALMLRGMLEKMKGEKKNNTKKFKELYNKYQSIATKLAWDFDIPTYAGKLIKKKILATSYKDWINKLENENTDHSEYSSKHEFYLDVVANLLWVQKGLCAYTEIMLFDEKELNPKFWIEGGFPTKFTFFGHLEHYDESLKKKKGWLWSNLFVAHSDVNSKNK